MGERERGKLRLGERGRGKLRLGERRKDRKERERMSKSLLST